MTKTVISIGIIGLPDVEHDPLWQTLLTLQRFKLAAAHSPVYSLLQSFAKEWGVAPCGSVRQLATCQTVQGLIWNHEACSLCLEKLGWGKGSKHLLLRFDVIQKLSPDRVAQLHLFATQGQIEIFPELLHRWTPTTLRLRELIATRLGPIRAIDIVEIAGHSGPDFDSSLLRTIDWLRMLLSLRKLTITANEEAGFQLVFDRPKGTHVTCNLRYSPETISDPDQEDTPRLIHVECESGTVEIYSDTKLGWRTDGDWSLELLTNERPAPMVLLDLFGRRIAGGIVPVPDLLEVLRTARVLQAIKKSRAGRCPIEVDDVLLPVDHGKVNF